MYIFFFLSLAVVSRLVSGAAVDRYENDMQQHTSVTNFLGTTKDRRTEEEHRSVGRTTVEYGRESQEEDYDEEYYYDVAYEDGMSGEYELELPRGKAATFVSFQNSSSVFVHVLKQSGMKLIIFLSGFVFFL